MSRESDLHYMYNWPEFYLWRKIFAKDKYSCFGGKMYEIRVPKLSSNERASSKFDQFREAVHESQ